MRYLPVLLITLCGCLLHPVAALAVRKEPTLGSQIIERLIEPETRLEALREVIIATQSDDPVHDWRDLPLAAFELYHTNILVTVCPQADGREPIYLVSYRSDHESFFRHFSRHRSMRSSGFAPVADQHKPPRLREASERSGIWPNSTDSPNFSVPPDSKLADCVFVFLTAEGKVIWPFEGDNVGEGDILKDLNDDGLYERVYASNFGVYDTKKGEPDIRVQALRVEAVEPDSERLLHVVLNWHRRDSEHASEWGWAVRDLEGDGLDEIIIGPVAHEDAEPEPTVVYRWDGEQKQYVGPEGGKDAHFLRFDPAEDLWDALHSVKEAGGMQYDPAARARAVKAEEPPAPSDRRSREPYEHRSLAAASKEELVEFMRAWSRASEDSAGGIRLEDGENGLFAFQPEWFSLPPKEAAFALADANQSQTHREKYLLYYPTNLVEPERVDWVVLSGFIGPGLEAIRISGEDAGRRTSVRFTRPLPESYPRGEFHWEWQSSRLEAERVEWLGDTLWWLAQLRSEPKERPRGHVYSRSFTSNCYPNYMETAAPGVRLLRDGKPSLIDIKTDHVSRSVRAWREAYGPDTSVGLVNALYEQFGKEFSSVDKQAPGISRIFETSADFIEDIEAGRMPPQLAQAMIRSAGDSGNEDLLPILRELETRQPPPNEVELEWRRLQESIDALPVDLDLEGHKAKIELEREMEAIEPALRDHLWSWLREPLRFSIRQLEAANDPDLLDSWARKAGEPGALWALRRLETVDRERGWQALAAVFAGREDWRSPILRYLAYEDAELAEEVYGNLPRAEQLAIVSELAGSKQPAEMEPGLVRDLLEAVDSEDLDTGARLRALRKLMPRNEPSGLEGPEADRILRDVLVREVENSGESRELRNLVYELCLVLLLRGEVPLPVEPYLEAAEAHGNAFSFGSFLGMVIHWAVVEESDEAREWLIGWAHDYIEKNAGAWSRFSEAIYTADLREFEPLLARLATLGPEAEEGDSAVGTGRKAGLEHGGRYHRARQILAVWNEPDVLTRAKCMLLLGLGFGHQYAPEPLYGPYDRTEIRMAELVGQLSSTERADFKEFVLWCEETLDASLLSYHSRRYLERLLETYHPPVD